jgi:hypothetical protein
MDLHFEVAHPQRHFAVEDHGRPGQAGHALDRVEQAREAADLGIHVLLAALDDQFARVLARR